AVEPGAQAAVHVLHAGAAPEAPALMQIGREDREPSVVLECRRRRSIAPALVAVTLAASDGVVELSADLERLGARPATRCRPELELHHMLARVGEERGKGLQVRQYGAAVGVREPALPSRHGAAGTPLVDR